jgi:uncharacterized integral membrane protein
VSEDGDEAMSELLTAIFSNPMVIAIVVSFLVGTVFGVVLVLRSGRHFF